jgi:serine/threonine protein kinase, bacterial
MPLAPGARVPRARLAAARWRRRPWVVLGSLTAAVLLVFAGVSVGIMIGRKTANEAAPTHVPSPSANPSVAAPTSSVAARPVPGELLDGVYQMDINRAQQTYNQTPDPQPPNVTTWWAFRSLCTTTGCVADGIQLNDQNDLVASPSAGAHPIVLDFGEGAWKSRPETVRFACIGPHGKGATQTTNQVLTLQPTSRNPLRGDMTVTVKSNECGQQGAQIVIPAVVGRTGDVPPGVIVPEPPAPTATPAAPTTTPAG